jgi:hypothetical protein
MVSVQILYVWPIIVLQHRIPRYDNHHGHDDRYDQYGQQGGNTKLFVGNISRDIQEYHIEGLFSIYGRWADLFWI